MKTNRLKFVFLITVFHVFTASALKQLLKDEGKEIEPLFRETLKLFLASSPAAHSYVISDAKSGINEMATDVITRHHSVTSFDYENYNAFESLLPNFLSILGQSNVFLLCSTDTILNIMERIASKNLESMLLIWFAFTEEDLDIPLSNSVREGTTMYLGKFLSSQKVDFLASRATIDNNMSFANIGNGGFTSENRASTSQPLFTYYLIDPPLVQPMDKLYSDFGGRELTVTANNDWPFFGQIELDNGTIIPDAGIDINVVNALGKTLNFRYKVVRPPDGQWGGPQPDGTVSGLIGMVARREAHLAIDEITVTALRESVTDFTTLYMQDSTLVVSPSPKPLSLTLAILAPFKYEVWGLLSVTLLVIGPILWCIDVAQKGPLETKWTVPEASFNTFRSLVIQGNRLATVRSAPRVLLSIWFLFCVIIYALYGSTLTAILAVPSYEKPVDSLLDALYVAKSGDFKMTTIAGTSLELLFKEATFGVYKDLYKFLDPNDLTNSINGGFLKVLDAKFLYIISGVTTKVAIADLGEENFYIGRETFYPQSYGIACQTGAPYLPAFNNVIMSLREAGIVDMWVKSELLKSQIKKQNKGQGGAERGPGAISLEHLQGAFFMMAIGYLLAGVVVVMEILISKTKMASCH